MPYDEKHECMYECNKGIKCECHDCNICINSPKKRDPELKLYYASGMTLIDGKWQSCGWTIEAKSFAEAARIADEDPTFRIHKLSDNVMY